MVSVRARATSSHEHNIKDLNSLGEFLPGMQLNTKYINPTIGTCFREVTASQDFGMLMGKWFSDA